MDSTVGVPKVVEPRLMMMMINRIPILPWLASSQKILKTFTLENSKTFGNT